MKKTFYFVRHGETDWNSLGKIQGQTDIPLNENGRAQARALASRLAGLGIEHIYSSPLLRAKETANIINEKVGVERIVVNLLIKEVSFGDLEGKVYEEFTDEFKRLFDAIIRNGDNDLKTLCVSFPNGECFHEVFGRFQKFMQSIPDDEDNVLIVSHGAFIKASLVKYLTERLSVKNCSCIKFKYDTETKVLSDFMCV